MRHHHIGIACRDIEASAAAYASLGYRKGEVILDPLHNVIICFLSHSEMPLVELLAPVDQSSPVVGYLEKNGVGPYHVCYEVDDLDESIRELKLQGYIMISSPKAAIALGSRRVAFLFHKAMGLVELLESL